MKFYTDGVKNLGFFLGGGGVLLGSSVSTKWLRPRWVTQVDHKYELCYSPFGPHMCVLAGLALHVTMLFIK